MLANRDLSIAFWSATRVEETSFFCMRSLVSSYLFSREFQSKLAQMPCLVFHVSVLAWIGGFVSYLWLLSLLEESLLASLLLGLLTHEVLGLGDLVNLLGVDAGQVDLLGGGDDVSGVDPSQGNTVDLEGAGDEQDALVEGLQEDDALATETAGEQDQDGTGLQSLAWLPGADGLADLFVKSVVSSLLDSILVYAPMSRMPISSFPSIASPCSPSIVSVACRQFSHRMSGVSWHRHRRAT